MEAKRRFKDEIDIGGRVIGKGWPAFIIAEAGVNHFGNINVAKKLVDIAIDANADAVKFQIYKTKNLISKKEAPDWFKRMKLKELTYAEFRELKKYCDGLGIRFLATAHDEESLDFLDEFDLCIYKIGSGEVSNHSFLRKVAKKHKPILISTGMYTQKEIKTALQIFQEEDNFEVILLHCVTAYPANPEDLNLTAIQRLGKEFKIAVGYSDHTVGNEMPYVAVALGACVIEKHITIEKNIPDAQDWIVSSDAYALKDLVNNIRRIEKALGNGKKEPSAREIENKNWARKSIVAKVNIKKGSKINKDMVCFKRPGIGISPVLIDRVIGRRCLVDINKDTMLKLEYLDSKKKF